MAIWPGDQAGMDMCICEPKVIGVTSRGSPIFDQLDHPDHEGLTSAELQRPMFDALDWAFYHAGRARVYEPGSFEYLYHREEMLHGQEVYRLIRKLWSRALRREKKAPRGT